MMLPFRRPLANKTTTAVPDRPAMATPVDAPSRIADAIAAKAAPHVDYDLHPLAVHELDHYIDQEIEDERFHVH
jgi:hypothetical protein